MHGNVSTLLSCTRPADTLHQPLADTVTKRRDEELLWEMVMSGFFEGRYPG